jgi:4-hydroxy-tetrahydrodipicolinate reductase
VSGTLRVAVAGAAGRLGSTLVARLDRDDRFELTSCLERPGSPHVGKRVFPQAAGGPVFSGADGDWGEPQVLIDASVTEAVAGHAARAAATELALLVAVTGLGEETTAALDRAAEVIPVLVAPNLSLGVTLLVRLAREAAKSLPSFDVEIAEVHHTAKRDSPSGTAQWLGREVARERGWSWPEVARWGRQGATGPRAAAEIGIHSLRAGTAAGEHRVWLGGPGEHLELTHVAESRECFAAGALEAVAWLAAAPPGRYNMEDVIDRR